MKSFGRLHFRAHAAPVCDAASVKLKARHAETWRWGVGWQRKILVDNDLTQ
jgi:hypothetical protein